VRVSVIIATWNARDVVEACLDSVDRQVVDGGFETIVVDNASTDGTAELLRGRADRVRAILNDRNEFYAGANNRAAAVAGGNVLFFLNPDTELPAPDVIERLAVAVERPGVAIAGPTLVNPDGSLQPSCAAHPSVGRALIVGSGAHLLLPKTARARVIPERWAHDRSTEVDWLMGAAIAVRADVFARLGGFWTTEYAEEQDLAYRARQLGLAVRFEHAVRVMHIGNHSVAKRWSEPERAVRVANAELAFLRAHYSRPRAAAIRAVVGLAYAARALAHAALGNRTRAAVYRSMTRVYASGSSG
jgi:GT2 family glycosyltransferase